MASEARSISNDISRIAAYIVYNLGGSIIVGMVHTAVAVAYIAKHIFYTKSYEAYHDAKAKKWDREREERKTERDQRKREADMSAQSATGFKRPFKKARTMGVRAKTAVAQRKDDFEHNLKSKAADYQRDAVKSLGKTRREAWYGMLTRGLVEMIPLFGSLYFTWRDNFSGRDLSIFEIDEMTKIIENEQKVDQKIHEQFPKQYNPWY